MNPRILELILRLIDLLALGLSVAPDVIDRYSKLRDDVRKFVTEKRDPTDDEFLALMAETQQLHDEIQNG